MREWDGAGIVVMRPRRSVSVYVSHLAMLMLHARGFNSSRVLRYNFHNVGGLCESIECSVASGTAVVRVLCGAYYQDTLSCCD